MSHSSQQSVLIFDGDCGFCTRTAQWLMRQNTHQRFEVLPWQTPGLLAQVGLNQQQVSEAAWYVDPDGHQYRGAGAINAAFAALGGIYGLMSLAYHLPGLKQTEDLVYSWVARNRYRLPGSTAACRLPGQTRQSSQ